MGGREGAGDPMRRTSGYVFPGALWLLPLLASECVTVCFSVLLVHCVTFFMLLSAFFFSFSFRPHRVAFQQISKIEITPRPSNAQNIVARSSRWRLPYVAFS